MAKPRTFARRRHDRSFGAGLPCKPSGHLEKSGCTSKRNCGEQPFCKFVICAGL